MIWKLPPLSPFINVQYSHLLSLKCLSESWGWCWSVFTQFSKFSPRTSCIFPSFLPTTSKNFDVLILSVLLQRLPSTKATADSSPGICFSFFFSRDLYSFLVFSKIVQFFLRGSLIILSTKLWIPQSLNFTKFLFFIFSKPRRFLIF